MLHEKCDTCKRIFQVTHVCIVESIYTVRRSRSNYLKDTGMPPIPQISTGKFLWYDVFGSRHFNIFKIIFWEYAGIFLVCRGFEVEPFSSDNRHATPGDLLYSSIHVCTNYTYVQCGILIVVSMFSV
jgi:hypothetical protein